VREVDISKTGSFTKAHVKYLDLFCYQEALAIGRYKLENGNSPTQSSLPEPMIADLWDNFETIKTLLSALGFPIFENWLVTNRRKFSFVMIKRQMRRVNLHRRICCATGFYL
jgi:hypothetical protein